MILILGGTADGRRLGRLIRDAGLNAVISMAGVTRAPAAQPLPTRVGGFGGLEGLRAYLRDQGVRRVVDCTHPFARQMSSRAVAACAAEEVPLIRIERPPWQPRPADRWQTVSSPEEVSALIPPQARVFLATGPKQAHRYGLGGHPVVLRVIDPRPVPLGWQVVVARPPFDVAQERAFLQTHRIAWLVCKNAGGAEGEAKLTAARALGLPVVMVDRPPVPEVTCVSSLWAALDWVKAP